MDVVVITALLEERQEMKACFGIPFESQIRSGIPYSFGSIDRGDRSIRIAAVQPVEAGPIPAAVLATRAILDWRPAAIIMTGICAGVEGLTRQGDLVVASQVFDHMAGTYRNGRLIPFQQSVSQEQWLLQIVNHLREDKSSLVDLWRSHPRPDGLIGNLDIHIGAMASGSFVVKDPRYIQSLLEKTSKLFALDMEAYGVACAAKMCSTAFANTHWLVVKGVVDFADANKNDDWHGYAGFTSAKFVQQLLDYALEREQAYQWILSRRLATRS